jgi:hypothetical protein
MSNRILSVSLRDCSTAPPEAEVLVTVVPERIDGGTEVRGRLMGPRCRFASTVEVAYHLRRVLVPTSRPAITLKAIIPEASRWAPETPHLYGGPVELWQDGVRCEAAPVRLGLRHASCGPRGVRLNGKPIRLRGREVTTCNDGEALALRARGYNLLLAPVSEPSRSVWDVADRLGFLVLGRIARREQAALTARLTGHPSCLGWLIGGEGIPSAELAPAALVGVEAGGKFDQANFAAVADQDVASLEAGLPVLVLGGSGESAAEGGPVVLGGVEA